MMAELPISDATDMTTYTVKIKENWALGTPSTLDLFSGRQK